MKKELFDDLLQSVREAGAIMQGETAPSRVFDFAPLDVKAIRKKLNKSQREFALMIGVSTSKLQNWERGCCMPPGPVHALLKIAKKNPRAFVEALEDWENPLLANRRISSGQQE